LRDCRAEWPARLEPCRLVRKSGGLGFDLVSLVPHLGLRVTRRHGGRLCAEGLRFSLLLDTTETEVALEGPALILLDEKLTVVATSGAADRWLADVGEHERPDIGKLPAAVYAVAARLRALEQSGSADGELLPRSRVRTRSGRWLIVHASRLSGAGRSNAIAVILEPAQPSEIAPVIVRAYDLTERERDVVQHVIRGLSTGEIAELLSVSHSTARAHVAHVLQKLDARNRAVAVRKALENDLV